MRILVLALTLCGALPAAVAGEVIANNTPGFVAVAKNSGAADASQTIAVSIWLKPHNRGALDSLAHDLYDPTSSNYRHWLKSAEFAAQFAPTLAEATTVEAFLKANNLKVIGVDPGRFYVRAQGTIADVENAFRVTINNYQVGNQALRSNAGDPYIEGPAAPLVLAVSGLDSVAFQHSPVLQTAGVPSNSSPTSDRTDFAHATDSRSFETVCFSGPQTNQYSTSGGYPKATYRGNVYSTGSSGCGYSPSDIYAAYNLNGLYAEGYNGAGQTVVLIEWCGSPTIVEDANTFSEKFGLPKLTASNFHVISYPGSTSCAGMWPGINRDVEWTHAIAPGASIDMLLPASSDYEDTDEAIYDAVNAGLGNVISGGYYIPEFAVGEAEANKEDLIAEIAAVEGIATNFASGDSGTSAGFHGTNVNVPADLPYATGVGGVSLALNADDSVAFQTGWESYESFLIFTGQINDPPAGQQFQGGSGGGPSIFFAKPWFQHDLKGKFRRLPDVSWLADPLTGGVIVVTEPTQFPPQVWRVAGGTELATDMFSALWAIANQEAGTPLGQAAPYLYSMPTGTVTDIVPYASPSNVTAVIHESSTVTNTYAAAQTAGVIEPLFGVFYSAIWTDPQGFGDTAWVLSFGQSYDLKTQVGWDDVTGLGVPNAKAFADWVALGASSQQ